MKMSHDSDRTLQVAKYEGQVFALSIITIKKLLNR